MMRAGHPRGQALAAAYRSQRSGRAEGGAADIDPRTAARILQIMPRDTAGDARSAQVSNGSVDAGVISSGAGSHPADMTSFSSGRAGANIPIGAGTFRPQISASREITPTGQFSAVTPNASISYGPISAHGGIDMGKYASPDGDESTKTPFYGAGVRADAGDGTVRYNATASPHNRVHHSVDYGQKVGPGTLSVGADSDGKHNLGAQLRYRSQFAAGGGARGVMNPAAISTALTTARRQRAAGGVAARPGYDLGGSPPPMPFSARQGFRESQEQQPYGFVNSGIPGRTDRHNADVASGSYVIPADVVSGLGEGNSLAGAKLTELMFSSGPHGTPLPRGGRGNSLPHPPAHGEAPFADGGAAAEGGEVGIRVAGGEVILPPHVIAYHPKLGALDPADTDPRHYQRALRIGHNVLDKWVVNERKATIKTLKKLPGPKKD